MLNTPFLILSFLLFSTYSQAQVDYCTAIRGNGELIPSHWSALSKLVEHNGMPESVAGGSSASVTAFLMESIAQNTFAKSGTSSQTRLKQALLLKSIYPYFTHLVNNSKVPSVLKLINKLKDQDSSIHQKLTYAVSSFKDENDMNSIIESVGKYHKLLNLEHLKRLEKNPVYFKKKLIKAVNTFGKFDAKEDDFLFFRDGLIDFKSFAILVGQIGDFYAGNTSEESKNALSDFLDLCHKKALNTLWDDLDPSCVLSFHKAVGLHLSSDMENTRIFEHIGKTLPSFMTTSVIHGENGVSKFNEYMTAYSNAEENKDYADFFVNPEKNLSFGYWGNSGDLTKASKGLIAYQKKNDLKSLKFLNLGEASWFDVLATSPAEPGLANIQKIPQGNDKTLILQEYSKKTLSEDSGVDLTRWNNVQYRDDMVSAGGWSDLHPSLILKSFGCENVVYVTRQDGESVFGQQVFLRLSGEKGIEGEFAENKISFWKNIEDNNKKGWPITKEIESTFWNRLYNLKNPKSSFNLSIKESDAIYCTNWNEFDSFNGEIPMLIKDAYNAPVFISDDNPLIVRRNFQDIEGEGFPGCQ